MATDILHNAPRPVPAPYYASAALAVLYGVFYVDVADEAPGSSDSGTGATGGSDTGSAGAPPASGGSSENAGSGGGSPSEAGASGNGTTEPPTPSDIPAPKPLELSGDIPPGQTYHRIYDFRNGDTCTTCVPKADDPYGACVPLGLEHDIERHETSIALEDQGYRCPPNPVSQDYDCFQEYICDLQEQPLTCKSVETKEPSSVTPTCKHLPNVGIELSIPPGVPGSYGYNVGIWPNEPVRPTFVPGSTVYVHAQFWLPTDQDVDARLGIDCTPFDALPESNVKSEQTIARVEHGTWLEAILPGTEMVASDSFTTIQESNPSCSGWLQCINSGVWPLNGDGAGDGAGGRCIVSYLEIAGTRDFCGFDRQDLELEVDDCAGCTLDHGLTPTGWVRDVPGVLGTDGKMTWRIAGKDAVDHCRKTVAFNVRIPSPDAPAPDDHYYLFDDLWDKGVGTAILIGRAARWKILKAGDVVETVEIGCNMARRNDPSLPDNPDGKGHNGRITVSTGTILPAGAADLPCRDR